MTLSRTELGGGVSHGSTAQRWLARERKVALFLLALGASTWPLGAFAVRVLHAPPREGTALFVPFVFLIPAGLLTLAVNRNHHRVPRFARIALHSVAMMFALAAIVFTLFVWWAAWVFGRTWVP